MAMTRILSQALSRATFNYHGTPQALIARRHFSDQSPKTQMEFIEVELDPSPSSQSDPQEAVSARIKKLEAAIHSVVVRRAAPDWLPFLPGYSYWVPPMKSTGTRRGPQGLIEVIGDLATAEVLKEGTTLNSLTADEAISFSSSHGWPSSTYFLEGTSPDHPISYVEVEAQIHGNVNNVSRASSSEEEEE